VLVEALSRRWPLTTLDTGQHYDYELNALLYEQLGVREPEYLLEVGSGDHASQTAAIVQGASRVFEGRAPRAVVVIGDTNSTLACALAAAKMRIPLVHVEAGLRATDHGMAEEINRRVVDVIGGLLCAPSERAAAFLHREHVPGTVTVTGDIARDVLVRNIGRAGPAADLTELSLTAGEPFVFATIHRAEAVDDSQRLASVVRGLSQLPLPVVFAAHPRTRAALEHSGLMASVGSVRVLPPLGYYQAIACVRDAALVVTDSGGVQREAYWLGTPCLTVRHETEWSETVELGANDLLPPEKAADDLPGRVDRRLMQPSTSWDRDAYGAGDAARRITDAVALWLAERSS
jgi:UDP-N-acetylglucosamine 2-epimerase